MDVLDFKASSKLSVTRRNVDSKNDKSTEMMIIII